LPDSWRECWAFEVGHQQNRALARFPGGKYSTAAVASGLQGPNTLRDIASAWQAIDFKGFFSD
jgi:hypothetical protein